MTLHPHLYPLTPPPPPQKKTKKKKRKKKKKKKNMLVTAINSLTQKACLELV